MRPLLGLSIAAALIALATTAHADEQPLRATDHDEIERVVHAFFDATRDGNTQALATVIPSDADFARVFAAGTEPLVARYRRAISLALTELRTRFANGQYVAMRGLDTGTPVRIERCGPFAQPASQCINGPVIEWTANGATQHMRVSRLVRVNGHWRILAPRL